MIYYFAIYDILLHERMLACASEDCFCMMRCGIWRWWTGVFPAAMLQGGICTTCKKKDPAL